MAYQPNYSWYIPVKERFQVTKAVWAYVVWNNRNHCKFSVNKKSRPTDHIQTNVSQCAECTFNRKQEFLGILPTLISSHHKLLEIHLLSSTAENSSNSLFHLSERKRNTSFLHNKTKIYQMADNFFFIINCRLLLKTTSSSSWINTRMPVHYAYFWYIWLSNWVQSHVLIPRNP